MSASKELKACIKEHPESEEAYFKYWTLLKELGNNKELEEISWEIMRVISNTSVPTNSWVEGIFKNSETLVILGKIDEALRTLKKI